MKRGIEIGRQNIGMLRGPEISRQNITYRGRYRQIVKRYRDM